MLEHLSDADRRRIVLARIYAQRTGMPEHFARELEGAIERGGDRRVIDSLIDRMREDEEIRAMPSPKSAKFPLDGRYRLTLAGITRNYKIKTDRNTFIPRVYDDASGQPIYARDEVKLVRAHLDVPEERLDGLIAYGHDTNTCGRCGRVLKTASSIARGLGDECAEAVAWELGQMLTGAEDEPEIPRYLVTFERVGRSSQGVPAPVKLRAIDGDHLAKQLTPTILPRLSSMNVSIVVDIDAGRGQILAGLHNAGSFTIEPIPGATTGTY